MLGDSRYRSSPVNIVSPLVNHIALTGLAGLLAWAAFEDVRSYKIPNRISLAILCLYPAHVLAAPAGVDWMGALAVAGVVFVVGFLMFSMHLAGAGDIKLLTVIALWSGPVLIGPFLIVTALAGGALSVGMLIRNWLAARSAAQSAGNTDKVPLSSSLKSFVPYGAAITVGGLYVAVRLFAL